MFKRFKDLDDGFRQVRLLSLLAIIVSGVVTGWAVYEGFAYGERAQQKVYVLVNGEAFQANGSDERLDLRIEAEDHVRRLHELVFNLDPDAKRIDANMRLAFPMADASVRTLYSNMKESGFITGIVSGNVSQRVRIDSVVFQDEAYPYVLRFRLVAEERLVRASSVTTRSLVTQGLLRRVERSVDNAHGLLVERLEVVENKDLKVQNR